VVLQPSNVTTEQVEWANLLGGKVISNKAYATFPLEAAKGLPPGEVDIVVVTEAGERRCKIGNKDRDRLFGTSR
jgi:hypothetical protein